MSVILFSIQTIAPTFFVIMIGALLRKLDFLTTGMSDDLSVLVFRLLLPALIVKTLGTMDKESSFTMNLVLVLLFFFFMTIGISWLTSLIIKTPPWGRGFFMAGSTFGNNAIIGYAFGTALYGEPGIARAAILSAILMPLSIFSAGIMLTKKEKNSTWMNSIKDFGLSMAKNPVMISLLLGIALWRSPFVPKGSVSNVLSMLSQAALPLALLAVGGSLEFKMEKKDLLEVSLVTVMKLAVMPLSSLGAALFFNIGPEFTGSILLMAVCPSSISFFVMARNQGHSPSKGAAIVTATTIMSAFAAALTAALLRSRGWV